MKTLLSVLMAFMVFATPVHAVEPDEILDDPVLEKRARDIGKNLRCVVCQNQAIDDSNSDLARDMRVVVRKRLLAGDADDEVIEYMVSRYGDFVLLEPPFKGVTYVLWLGPVGIVLVGLFAAFMFFRRRPAGGARTETPPKALSAEEEARIQALLDEDKN